jgi:BirA family biotin operon repressor/biotin-[acetyl-CoA-carboxylase] ligase
MMNEPEQKELDLKKIESEVRAHPRLRGWISELLLFDSVDSTNGVALQMGSAGMPGGVLIIAETQERGRGRLSRNWVSPRGVNLYFSLLLRPHQPPRDFPLFSLVAAVALVSAIQSNTLLPAGIKWPNDILVGEKKVAGILLETGAGGGNPYLVIGIGINVNWDPLPPELPQATSLSIAAGHPIDRNSLLLAILTALWEQCHLFGQSGGGEAMIQALSAHCVTLGKSVRVETPQQAFEGVAQAILPDGKLLLLMPNGASRKILLGDITHLTSVSLERKRYLIGH